MHSLVSTAADYLRFCRMLLAGGELDSVRLLGPRTTQLMPSRTFNFRGQLQSIIYSAIID